MIVAVYIASLMASGLLNAFQQLLSASAKRMWKLFAGRKIVD